MLPAVRAPARGKKEQPLLQRGAASAATAPASRPISGRTTAEGIPVLELGLTELCSARDAAAVAAAATDAAFGENAAAGGEVVGSLGWWKKRGVQVVPGRREGAAGKGVPLPTLAASLLAPPLLGHGSGDAANRVASPGSAVSSPGSLVLRVNSKLEELAGGRA